LKPKPWPGIANDGQRASVSHGAGRPLKLIWLVLIVLLMALLKTG